MKKMEQRALRFDDEIEEVTYSPTTAPPTPPREEPRRASNATIEEPEGERSAEIEIDDEDGIEDPSEEILDELDHSRVPTSEEAPEVRPSEEVQREMETSRQLSDRLDGHPSSARSSGGPFVPPGGLERQEVLSPTSGKCFLLQRRNSRK